MKKLYSFIFIISLLLVAKASLACNVPTGFSGSFPWSDRVNLNWTSSGTNWEIEYGPSGFTVGTGTRIAVTSHPYVLTGLSPNTNYQVYIRDSCGIGNVSAWVGPIYVKTLCGPLTAPYSENFSGADFSAGSTFNSPGTIDPCWIRNDISNYVWKGGPPLFTSTLTGPSVDHTTGTTSGKYAFTASIGFTSTLPNVSVMRSQIVDVSALTTPELSFWYHMFGQNIGTLEFMVSDKSGNFSTLWTKTGQQQASASDPWKEAIIDLSAYAGDTIIFQFKATKTVLGSLANISIDDIDIHEQPSCPKSQYLQVVGQSFNSVTLQWQSGGASDWNIEYGTPGFSHGSGTIVNATSNPFTVTGLSGSTSYQFYVRDSCGAGDVSVWSVPVTTSTDCSPVSAPYTENFDGSTFTVGSFTTLGSIGNCWKRGNTTGDYQWTPQTTVTTFGTGPQADHTSGSGKFLCTNEFFATGLVSSRDADVTTPLIDLSPLTTPELTFWYHMYGPDIDTLAVDIYANNTWTNIYTLAGQQQVSKTDLWKKAIVNISAYANDTIKLRFHGARTDVFGFQMNMAIDDIDVHEQPSCPQPSAIVVQSTGGTTVTLGWTTGGASNWQIEYGPSGYSVGSGTVVNANTNPFTVTGLNSSTVYDFYVRDSCGATDQSAWTGPVTGATDCLPVTAPFTENFDGAVWSYGVNFNDTGSVSPCWKRSPLVDYYWRTGPATFSNPFTGPSADHTSGSGQFIYAESVFSGGTAPFTAKIETPQIDCSSLGIPELTFWYHMFGTNIGTLDVQVDDGSGYVTVFTKTGQQQTSNSAAWQQAVVNLAAYANSTFKIRFKATKSSFATAARVAIDDISVHQGVCPEPSNITFTGITTSGANINWTSTVSPSTVEVVPSGQAQGTGTFYYNATSPLTVSGLNAGTDYVVYIRDSCSTGQWSNWYADTVTTTACPVTHAMYSYTTSLLKATFNNFLTTNADSIYWDFGDGATSNSNNPVHTYSTAGTYLVTLQSFNNCGNSDTLADSISVCDILLAAFTDMRMGDTVTFDGSNSTGAAYYIWDFGDGTNDMGKIVKHAFATPGDHNVTLTVANDCGDTITASKFVKDCEPPVASWTYTLLGTTGSGMKVQFDGTASQNAITFDWDFGDGSTVSGITMPQHTYLTPGLFYQVTLKVKNLCGDVNVARYKLSEVGLEEYDLSDEINLFPNPATNRVRIEWAASDYKIKAIHLYDISGREVLNQTFQNQNNGAYDLNITRLNPGYYQLEISMDKGSALKKLIVK